MAASTVEYERAVAALERALALPEDDITRDACIQRFEFCIELAWKVSRRMMGTSTTAPKQVIREMAQNHLIDDPAFWLEAIEQRNLSSHTYNERLAAQVYAFARHFLPELIALCARLKAQ
jgi:nucleotidyltransferase substrate binding protein (TIGR01987 family)